MITKKISGGTVHTLPADLRKALTSSKSALATWESLTPLARNEWICWNTYVKQAATRAEHIKRTIQDLQKGKRRPCCWYGCVHRPDKQLSQSQQWVLSKRANAK